MRNFFGFILLSICGVSLCSANNMRSFEAFTENIRVSGKNHTLFNRNNFTHPDRSSIPSITPHISDVQIDFHQRDLPIWVFGRNNEYNRLSITLTLLSESREKAISYLESRETPESVRMLMPLGRVEKAKSQQLFLLLVPYTDIPMEKITVYEEKGLVEIEILSSKLLEAIISNTSLYTISFTLSIKKEYYLSHSSEDISKSSLDLIDLHADSSDDSMYEDTYDSFRSYRPFAGYESAMELDGEIIGS